MGDNTETVRSIYAAFGRGDVPYILGVLAPDVDWEGWSRNYAQEKGVPWLERRKGREGAAAFFGIAGGWVLNDFRVEEIMSGDDAVAVCVSTDFTLPNGGRIKDEEVHLWRFDRNGQVRQLRHYVDTAKHVAASRGESTA